MKVLFILFLLTNVVYFYFQSTAEDGVVTSGLLAQQKLPAGAKPLVLLRERGLGISESAQASADQKNKIKSAERTVKKAELGLAAKSPVSSAKPVGKIAPQRLPAKPKKSAAAACFTLGPFVEARLADRAIQAANSMNVKVVHRKVSQRTPKGYWVYLAASTSYKAAKRKVIELQKKGVKDLFIMGKGARKNAISLGLFKNKKVAEERLKQVKQLGLKGEFETQYRVSEQSWLDMTVAGDQTATVASLTEVADEYPTVNLTQRRCQ